MLLLTFQIGDERYAIEADQVVEVIPVIKLKRIPLATHYVAGVFNYRSTPVPAIDLGCLFGDRPCRSQMSTRIILIRFRAAGGDTHVLGVIAEQVTETIRRNQDAFVDSGVAVDGAPFLRGVCHDTKGLIQLIDAQRLLPESVAKHLFRAEGAPAVRVAQ